MPEKLTHFLIIDDDDVDVMNVKRAFQRTNSHTPVHVAHDGIEALAILRSRAIPIDRCVILLDINMPRMNGLEFLQELRSDSALQSIPVVILTTSNAQRDRQQVYSYNVAGYITKPVVFAEFTEVISALTKYWSLMELA